ncbi:hypothetical protein [Nitrosomonas europaea]|uniref:hypothetical protein n=1 Tax=Nitrosomonas europaea TaxID=915 RepID=UPI000301AFAA|nr:hypothetical protein [Nitrosomonas europaea]
MIRRTGQWQETATVVESVLLWRCSYLYCMRCGRIAYDDQARIFCRAAMQQKAYFE